MTAYIYKSVVIILSFSLLIFTIFKVIETENQNNIMEIRKQNTDYFLKNYDKYNAIETIAINYFNDKNYPKALELFTELANKEMTQSLYFLGLIYENGFGVKKDIRKAAILYKQSALQGFYTPLMKLRNLINKNKNILNDDTPLSKAFNKVVLEPNENNIKNLLKFYEHKEIPCISNDFHYEFGKNSFISLLDNPQILKQLQ